MLGLTIKWEWDQNHYPIDGSLCYECENVIADVVHAGYLFIYANSGQIPEGYIPSAVKVCDKCYNELECSDEPKTET